VELIDLVLYSIFPGGDVIWSQAGVVNWVASSRGFTIAITNAVDSDAGASFSIAMASAAIAISICSSDPISPSIPIRTCTCVEYFIVDFVDLLVELVKLALAGTFFIRVITEAGLRRVIFLRRAIVLRGFSVALVVDGIVRRFLVALVARVGVFFGRVVRVLVVAIAIVLLLVLALGTARAGDWFIC
jgi:hypothetical protein